MAGQIKVNGIQIGDDATDTRNFFLRTLVDGTIKLSRGALGALGDLFSFDANGKLILTNGFGAGNTNQSCVRVQAANGYGSTNTNIRRFSNILLNQGTDIVYADSATLGATFTVAVAGMYAISYVDQFTTASALGASLNSAQLTTALTSVTAADRLMETTSVAGASAECSVTVYIPAGGVIRPHTDAGVSSGTRQSFTVSRVS